VSYYGALNSGPAANRDRMVDRAMFEDPSKDLVYTISEFCAVNKICRSTFYNLIKNNKAPTVMRVGKSIRISYQAAHEWRTKCEHG
jgi:excisionase family DNA binding protein